MSNIDARSISPWTVAGETFELDKKFKVVDYLGAGTVIQNIFIFS